MIGLAELLKRSNGQRRLRSRKACGSCEKPMARTVTEAEAMLEAAENSGRTLMIAHVWRSNQEMQWLRDVVHSRKWPYL